MWVMRGFASHLFGALLFLVGCSPEFRLAGTGGGDGTGGAGTTSSTSTGETVGVGGAGGASSSVSGPGGGPTTTTTTTGTGGAPPQMNSGDCVNDSDCKTGQCVELTPGGFRVCQTTPKEANNCDIDPPGVGCCNSSQCEGGAKCFPSTHCGGIVQQGNECQSDQCSKNDDCKDIAGICAEAGTLGNPVNQCKHTACKLDTDCKAKPGGICAPVEDPCCPVIRGLFCVYPNGGCRTSADCPGGSYCEIEGDTAFCKPGGPNCPL